MATIKKSATRLARKEARQERRAERRGDDRVSMKPMETKSATVSVSAPKVSNSPSSDYRDRQGTKHEDYTPPKKAEGLKPMNTPKAPTTEESFGQAFAREKKAGAKTFTWKGKSYTTETKEDAAKKTSSPVKKTESKPLSGTSDLRTAIEEKTGKKSLPTVGGIPAAKSSTSAPATAKKPGEMKFKMTGGPESNTLVKKPAEMKFKMTGGPESNTLVKKPAAKTAPKGNITPPANRKGLPAAKCGKTVKSRKK